jgi:DNA-binding MarR family transcriptional regulator
VTNQAHSPMPPISEQWAVAGLFGLFGEDLTHVVDKNLGGDWAENDEILALLALRHEPPPTTRHLAQVSGMNRRTVSRMVARLRRDDIVVVGHSPSDRRSVTVGLTDHGRSCFGALAQDVVTLFETHRGTAAQICELLGCDRPAVVTGLDPLTLLEQLVTAGADLVRSIQPPADRQSLSGSQRTALIRIASGEAVRPVDLGPTLGVSRSGVAYVLDQLCHKGLVQRRRDEVADDRRAVVLTATEEGRRGAASVIEAIESHRDRFCSLFAAVRDRPRAAPH